MLHQEHSLNLHKLTFGMDGKESHSVYMGADTEASAYGHDGWSNVSPYSQSPYGNSPMNEYASYSHYPHGLPQDTFVALPSTLSQPQHTPITPAPNLSHQKLALLNSSPWPSQLITSSAPEEIHSSAHVPILPAPSRPESPIGRPRAASNEKVRKALTADQKRQMCLFHEENPGTRQADIGARFGVERSTVSKVLRHKDQILKKEHEMDRLQKKTKGKHPNFDRTLSNYVRRRMQPGFQLSDDEIMDQAIIFARASENADAILECLNDAWLQHFKQKHNIKTGRLTRRASETSIPDRSSKAPALRKRRDTGPYCAFSPSSPAQHLTTLSDRRSDEDLRAEGDDFSLEYRPAASRSTSSLVTNFPENAHSSITSEGFSPTGAFTFSPDPVQSAFQLDTRLQLPFDYQEQSEDKAMPRELDYRNQHSRSESITPRQASSATMQPLTRCVPIAPAPPPDIDTTMASPTFHQSSGGASLTPRSSGTPVNTTTMPSTPIESPVTPSQEDAWRAANTLLNYLQSPARAASFDQGEYYTVASLTKKLQIQPSHPPRHPSVGLSRIPEGDHEAAALGEQ